MTLLLLLLEAYNRILVNKNIILGYTFSSSLLKSDSIIYYFGAREDLY